MLLLCDSLYARTVILEGRLQSRILVTQQMGFGINKPMSRLTFRFALPAAFSNRAVSQNTQQLDIRFDPQPVKVDEETDKFGNRFRIVTWNNLDRDARVNITFETNIKSELSAMESAAQFPLSSISPNEMIYTQPSPMVQSNAPEIISLSKKLTANAATEYEAVTAVLNYVIDNIKYKFNPPQYDSLYTLRTKSGNCQNFAHLSMALLRAAGIPARIVGGISLKQPWKIPVGGNSSVVQSLGQGGHAWMEIYFPDLGWLSYDPQQSKQFTSSRHIKQTHGLDSDDINDSWRSAPYMPDYNELVDAKFLDDAASVRVKEFEKPPKAYLFSNNLIAKAGKPSIVKPPTKPPIEEKPPVVVKPKPKKGTTVEFGNTDFPSLVDVYQVIGDRGVRILDKETTEYVTSRYVYAQAFDVEHAMRMQTISLAMRKFGGDGTVYVDIVADDNGRPSSLAGVRSTPIFIDQIAKRPGYYWVDFGFPSDTDFVHLKKGRYWIVLRYSGEAIMNWFYIPGNPYGDGDDTRSTLKGYKWEDIQNYDFVFKVRGIIE
jgi:transglutaminase-like putative cysteine protease